jgi:hypothetical protein
MHCGATIGRRAVRPQNRACLKEHHEVTAMTLPLYTVGIKGVMAARIPVSAVWEAGPAVDPPLGDTFVGSLLV